MPKLQTCEWCGYSFTPTDDNRFFCSEDCRDAMIEAEEDLAGFNKDDYSA